MTNSGTPRGGALSRLSMMQAHIATPSTEKPQVHFPNACFSSTQVSDDRWRSLENVNRIPNISRPMCRMPLRRNPANGTAKDSASASGYEQPEHPLVMIPGPVEFSDNVLAAMSTPSQAHTGQPFVLTFQSVLRKLRQLLFSSAPKAQPFVISGSGTLGWDFAASNLVSVGDSVLVLSTGFFGDSFGTCFESYGCEVEYLRPELGSQISEAQLVAQLKSNKNKYKAVTITQTDTASGVLSNVAQLSSIIRQYSPESLVVVDAVCSMAVEEIRFDDWGIDFVLTASQKAMGCPAGLAIMFASERAMQKAASRKGPRAFYADMNRWAGIMQAYENNTGAYFATPSVQLVNALHVSLCEILGYGYVAPMLSAAELPARQAEFLHIRTEPQIETTLQKRFAAHRHVAKTIQQFLLDSGLQLVSRSLENSANGMTAAYLPEGIAAKDFLASMGKKGIVLAGGLQKGIAPKYFRIGHMGVGVMEPSRGDVAKLLEALKETLEELKR